MLLFHICLINKVSTEMKNVQALLGSYIESNRATSRNLFMTISIEKKNQHSFYFFYYVIDPVVKKNNVGGYTSVKLKLLVI